MKPLQVWLPQLGFSLGLSGVARDMRRAFEDWKAPTDLMFLLPGLGKTTRWNQDFNGAPMAVCAVSAEHQDKVAICHVGANGCVFAPFDPREIHGRQATELLSAWLNLPLSDARLCVPFEIEGAYPYVVDGLIAKNDSGQLLYVEEAIALQGQAMPLTPLEAKGRREIEYRWPPGPDWPQSIYPDAESTEARAAVGTDANRSTDVLLRWPPPFDRLFGWLAAFDVVQSWNSMRSVARMENSVQALSLARSRSAGCVSEGYSTRRLAYFWPEALALNQAGEPIRAFWERYGIKAHTLEEAYLSKTLDDLVPVTRVWGGVGLLWALLIARLESALEVRSCADCGTVLGGRRKRCGPDDNVECYRRHLRDTKRRSRLKDD